MNVAVIDAVDVGVVLVVVNVAVTAVAAAVAAAVVAAVVAGLEAVAVYAETELVENLVFVFPKDAQSCSLGCHVRCGE